MSEKFITNTASLKATIADIRNLDAKQIKLKGQNILDYIKEAEFDSYDTRDPQLKNDELDIWNTEISLSEEGHIEVKPHTHTVLGNLDTLEITLEGMTDSQLATLRTAIKVIDNEVLGENDEHIMYWQTDGLIKGNLIFDTVFTRDTLTSFYSNLSNLTNGDYMFNWCQNFTSFNGDLKGLVSGFYMFSSCQHLTSFTSDLSSLQNGYCMFSDCCELPSFNCDLPNLTDGQEMFYYCQELTSFSSELPSLQNGQSMFSDCCYLTSFSSELPSLQNGQSMFQFCSSLTSFSSDLSSLTNGNGMFHACENLESFSSYLSNLTDGTRMFSGCKLDAKSISNIIHALPTRETTNSMDIGIGCDNTEEDKLLFAQECHCDTWQELLDEFSDKNWQVLIQCNGRPTTTYNMRRGETLPVFVKIEEVIMPTEQEKKRHKPHYSHTSLDGSKFYQLIYFHSTNGSTDGYDTFNNLEEAVESYNVTPKTNEG